MSNTIVEEIRRRNFAPLVFVVLAVVTSSAAAEDPVPPKGDDAELAEFLKPAPAKEPADALKTFEVLRGFRVDLVAHEPMVTDPVAGAFDEDGRLYIAELNDYPYREPESSGFVPLVRQKGFERSQRERAKLATFRLRDGEELLLQKLGKNSCVRSCASSTSRTRRRT